jgi:hypothetical protein
MNTFFSLKAEQLKCFRTLPGFLDTAGLLFTDADINMLSTLTTYHHKRCLFDESLALLENFMMINRTLP